MIAAQEMMMDVREPLTAALAPERALGLGGAVSIVGFGARVVVIGVVVTTRAGRAP